MAAPRLISSVEVYDADRSARIAIPDVSPTTYDLYPYVADQGLEVREVLGDYGREVTISKLELVGPGAPPVVANPAYLTRRRVIRLNYDDSSFEEMRIVKANRELSGDSPPTLELEPIWADLATRMVRETAGTRVVPTVYMIGRTAQSILDQLEGYFPSHFQAGSAGTHAPTVVSLVSVGDNPLKLLRDLCAAVGDATGEVCEWDYAWNATDSKYDIDLTDGIGGTLDHPVEMGAGGANNRRRLQQTEDYLEYFSRVIPLGGPDEEVGTIAEAYWSVTGATYDGGTGRTTLTLADDPIYVTNSPGTTGIEFGSSATGYFAVVSTAVPATVVVTGSATALSGAAGKFRLSTGADLVYLSDPAAEDVSTGAGIVERVDRLSDVAPVENLLVAGGVSPDLSDWTAGMPNGTQAVGSPTIAQTTTARYVQAGTSSADVQADTDEGIRTDAISLAPTDDDPYYSAWFGVRILTGSIRMELIGSDGESYPLGESAEGEGDVFQGLSLGGMRPPSGNAYLQVTAREDTTRFVVDSWTLTNTSTPYPWTEEMGPVALWHIAGALLAVKGGIQPDAYSGDWYDLSFIDTGRDEAAVGGKCQIKDSESGGTYGVDVEIRLVELARQYGGGNYRKEGRFGSRARDLTGFLLGGNRRRTLPGGGPPTTNPQAVTGRLRAVVSTDSCDLFLRVEAPDKFHPIEATIYQDDPTGSALQTHQFTTDGEIGPADYTALDDIALPDKEHVRWWALLEPAIGAPIWVFTTADRDGVPGGEVTPDDFKAAAGFECEYDDDTTQVKVKRPGGSGTAYEKTWAGLSGGGRVTFTLGSTVMDDGSTVPPELSEGETTGAWIIEYTGGGETIEMFRGPLHGPIQPFECRYAGVIYTATGATIDDAEALKYGSNSGQTLSYKDGSDAWADAATNPDDITVDRPASGGDPKEVLLGVKDGAVRRGIVSVSVLPVADPKLISFHLDVLDDSGGSGDDQYTFAWEASDGVTDAGHSVELEGGKEDDRGAVLVTGTESSPATNTSKQIDDAGAGDGSITPRHWGRIRLRDASGNIIQALEDHDVIPAT